MKSFRLLGVEIRPDSRELVLEKIKKYIGQRAGSLQIISLNPEIIILARGNNEFRKIVQSAQIQIADGFGVLLGGKLFGAEWERLTGVDLMQEMIKMADSLRLRVLLIGGKGNLADRLAKCYSDAYREAKFLGIEGIKNIKNPIKQEERATFSIVADYKPHFVFAAFGSPDQELWLDRHKDKFSGSLLMGVGGAFDFLIGDIARAPRLLRRAGLEWFFRLVLQPWRLRRQLRLVYYLLLLFRQRFNLL